jgi:ribosomal protein S27AE
MGAYFSLFFPQPQEDQAQEEEGQDGHPQVLQGRLGRQDQAPEARVPPGSYFSVIFLLPSTSNIRRLPHQPQCGAGIFMAWHQDRQTCGKCGLTYSFGAEGQAKPN